MRIYMVKGYTYRGDDTTNKQETCLGFVRTEQDARKHVSRIKKTEPSITFPSYELCEIGNQKEDLINFLNSFCFENGENVTKYK